jgi:hypothetical protein
MSDQPQYRNTEQSTRPQTAPYGDQWSPAEVVQVVRLDRPIYTGMMVGFGLMIASILFVVIISLFLSIIGLVFGGALLVP